MGNEEKPDNYMNRGERCRVELHIDDTTRTFELRAVGSAFMVKQFLLNPGEKGLKKLSEEAEFDRIVSELLNEWIYDDNAEYTFDISQIKSEEDLRGMDE